MFASKWDESYLTIKARKSYTSLWWLKCPSKYLLGEWCSFALAGNVFWHTYCIRWSTLVELVCFYNFPKVNHYCSKWNGIPRDLERQKYFKGIVYILTIGRLYQQKYLNEPVPYAETSFFNEKVQLSYLIAWRISKLASSSSYAFNNYVGAMKLKFSRWLYWSCIEQELKMN